uniref:Endonuclease/exonuclease/phosphatase domain-containing protein n=1 Tax=Clytia hemisphaerica TaxID=252671 RepID=A0A7M5X6N4_9CNID
MANSDMAGFRVFTINMACAADPNQESNKSRRSAISALIHEQDPDIILLQNVNRRRDVEFIDFMLAKVWRHYNYYMKRVRSSTAIMAKANLFAVDKVKFSDLNIIGTAEQKDMIQNHLSLVRLTHKASKNFMFVGSWSCPVHIGMTDEKKKRISSLLISMMRREAVGAFWVIGGDFNIAYDQSSIRMAQKTGDEFFNLVEDTGRVACSEDNSDNYFVFSGKSAHRRMTLKTVETPKCNVEKQQKALNCYPLIGLVTITWAAASPRHSLPSPTQQQQIFM